jgi:SAM-dependent methyltransferase
MMWRGIRERLAHPLTLGLNIDAPQTTLIRRRIIKEKKFLWLIYREWYRAIAAALPPGPGPLLELGAGAGFLREFIPGLITSEIFYLPDIDAVIDGQQLPLGAGVLRGIVMIDVLHHLPQPRRFLVEAARCIRPGGAVVMIEPWVTPWSRLIYLRLHQEPFCPEATAWEFPPSGPLSGANGALPWIIFARDRGQFEREFPEWRIRKIELGMPIRYLLSGGVSLVSLNPAWTFGLWRRLEELLKPLMKHLAMFARIELVRMNS